MSSNPQCNQTKSAKQTGSTRQFGHAPRHCITMRAAGGGFIADLRPVYCGLSPWTLHSLQCWNNVGNGFHSPPFKMIYVIVITLNGIPPCQFDIEYHDISFHNHHALVLYKRLYARYAIFPHVSCVAKKPNYQMMANLTVIPCHNKRIIFCTIV